MNRRHFLTVSAAAIAAASLPMPLLSQGRPPMITRWNVLESEGYDAIAFLGALSGGALYRATYAADADAFSPKLPAAIRADITALTEEADKQGFGLLWPGLANLLSYTSITTLDSVIAVLGDLEARIRSAFLKNPARDEKDWAWVVAHATRLRAVFIAMRDAGFPAFRRERIGSTIAARITEVSQGLAGYDVIRWQEKLTGRSFDPTITVVLMYFSKPHGVSLRGQTFLQAADYDTATTVRIAAHEMLHPPFPMEGPVATAAIAALNADP
ncbi:MAG: twin-arginine translocation signal domain-containing protein, partial [Pseudomonadota bacterium]|nr:twin-arginine translocation signal domain-containing protein [Pseudomonadota bacterium]